MTLFGRILQLLLKVPVLQKMRLLFYFFDSFILLFLPKPEKQNGKKKVLIVFPYSLGDAVMFYGIAKQLRRPFPPERFSLFLACHRDYQALFEPVFDKILAVDYRKSAVNPIERIRMLKRFRQEHFDIAIDPMGAEECSPNVYTMNAVCAEEKIGVLSAQSKEYQCPTWLRRKIYSWIICRQEQNVHKIRHYAEVLSEVCGQAIHPCLADLSIGNQLRLPAHFSVIFPSASSPAKCWPVERYVEIAERLYEETGIPVVVCGTENDRKTEQEFLSRVRHAKVLDLLGTTSVMEIIELIGKADLVVTNDTGIYHIAVATGRKTCVVSGEYVYDSFLNYFRDGYDVEKRLRIMTHEKECRNCINQCIYSFEKTYPCVAENTVEEVWGAVQSLLPL